MPMSEFREMDGMERRFYVPPEFRQQNQIPRMQVGPRGRAARGNGDLGNVLFVLFSCLLFGSDSI